MRKKLRSIVLCFLLMGIAIGAKAQSADSLTLFKMPGTIWGLFFGDYAIKTKADTATYGRGGNQYSKMPAPSNFVQFRRVYLGYNCELNKRFSAEILFAVEDDLNQGSIGNQTTAGDVLSDGKIAPYLKLANIRWKNIFPGSDLVFGQVATPAFPLLSEQVWGYRSIERTVADIRRTPSFHKGFTLQGHYGKDGNYGYNIMVGNGSSAKPETDNFKWLYADVWAKFLNKRLIIDLYQDYERLNWNPIQDGQTDASHHDRNMTKLLIAYSVPKFTIGMEAFVNTLMGDVEVSAYKNDTNYTYYRTTIATAVSLYARGRLYKDVLGFMVRYDNYNPGHNINSLTNHPEYLNYVALTPQYDPTTKEQFISLGLDYTPYSNVHIMPNVWMNTYQCTLPSSAYYLNNHATGVIGTDLVYRLTVYYIFGKKDSVRY